VVVLPALISGVLRRKSGTAAAMLPPLALAALGAAAWGRGMVNGFWVDGIDGVMAVAALGLLWVPLEAARKARSRKSHGSPRRAPGLPRKR
jgi:hypothetical protein